MRLTSRPIVVAASLAMLAAIARPSAQIGGGEATANMQVSANVIRKCTITADPLNFGSYDPVQANATSPLDGQATITVACTKGTTVSIGMDVGQNALTGARRMASGGTEFLGYEVYKDPSHADIWGDTAGARLDGGVAPSRDPRNFIAYGRIAGGQDAAEGNFQDTVLITVDF